EISWQCFWGGGRNMKNPVWTKALKNSADPQRARHHLDLLAATSAAAALKSASAEQARILGSLFSGSQALSGWLIANPDLISMLSPEIMEHHGHPKGLRREE